MTRSWVTWNPAPFTSHAHLDMQMQYSFDYCQHVSLPYSSQQRGTFYFRTPHKVQVFGVCCEPLSRQVFFLIDEAEQAGKGAVVVVSLVHAFFHLHGLEERRVTLQADNCVGQNKNTTMMWYLAWRVITGQHDTIQLNFMLPGHTKFRPNSYFGLFKKYYQRQDHVYDMDDLADCVRLCGQDVACVPQLYQDWHYYDWNAFLGQWFSPLAGLGRCYTFRFDRKHPGVMKMKTLPSDANPTEVTMLRAGVAITDIKDAYQSQVMPPVITPSGLSLTRSLYLYERVREYVRDPQKRDKVCPKPPPGAGPDSGNASSLPESDQPGPSAAIPHSPLLRVMSLQRTHTVKCKTERMVVFLAGGNADPAVNRALTLIQKMGPSLGLFVNVSKCELFGCGDLSSFPPEMKVSRVPNLVILGAPIGDLIFCAKFVAQKRADAAVLLSQLAEVGAEDPQVAFLLLRQCAAFCKLVHLARSAPPSHIAEGLALFDKDVRQCFAECTAVDAADVEWMQAQLSLSRGGLGLRSLSSHCVAAYLASISSSGCDKWNLLVEPIELFNGLVPAEDAITLETLATSNMRQHSLSGKIEDQQFRQLFHISSPANRARLLSISSRHAASWLTVVPSPGLNLHLEPNEFQIAVKWWLGMDVSFGSCCPHCPDHRLDPLGHHALTCKHGGGVVLRHNSLRDVFVEFCHRACLGGQVEVGSGQGHDRLNSRPADVLVKNWHLGKPAAFDLTITSPLNPTTLTEAGVKCGSSAQVAEVRKHAANDGKCKELGWVCIPLAVESYGCWGMEAQESFKRLAARLAIQMGCSRSQATTTLYQRLSLSLVRANARALLSRARVHLEEGG
eukprot:Em0012g385a